MVEWPPGISTSRLLSPAELLRIDRQLANARARRREKGVAEGRQDRRQRRLAQAGGRVVAEAEVHLHGGRFAHSKQPESVEILLHHPAGLDGDRLVERRAQPVEYRALRLVVGARG